MSLKLAIDLFGRVAYPIVLRWRLKKGKEDAARIGERKGYGSAPHPNGKLIWVHGASVGEAQSAMIIINQILQRFPEVSVLITTGTKTSARFLEPKLHDRLIHQYIPMDNTPWVKAFLDYWEPDAAIWMESEFWPQMLFQMKDRGIPSILLNGRMSMDAHKNWRWGSGLLKDMLSAFAACFMQSEWDAARIKLFRDKNIHVLDNIKYAAAPLTYDERKYTALKENLKTRPVWLFASTHKGEELIAAQMHKSLVDKYEQPVVSIIVPRHPDRIDDIIADIKKVGKLPVLRSKVGAEIPEGDQIYVADTMGELGLFYTLSPIAVIGRTLSEDGGGGHNPIEAAHHDCAILHGPLTQNLHSIFQDMDENEAAIMVRDAKELRKNLENLMGNVAEVHKLTQNAKNFAESKRHVTLDTTMQKLTPLFKRIDLIAD